MNATIDDELKHKRDAIYYNQLLSNDRKVKAKKTARSNRVSFSSRKVDLADYIYIPEDWKGLAYTIYIVLVPYLVGSMFLYFFVASFSYDNFKLLNTNAFLIVWLIGYEVVAVFILLFILSLYLREES